MAVIIERGGPIEVPEDQYDSEYRATALALLECICKKTVEDVVAITKLKGVTVIG